MAAYLITRKDVESLETVVFAAGPHDNEEAVALFTDSTIATQYIEDADWADEYTVAGVEPIALLRWLLKSYDDGIQHVVLDPTVAEQEAGERLNTLSIQAHLEHAGQRIVDVAHPEF